MWWDVRDVVNYLKKENTMHSHQQKCGWHARDD